MRAYAVALLMVAAVHEFSWLLLPSGLGLQGNWRAVTQWPLICACLLGLHLMARDRFLSAVCAAVAVMSSTTAGCAGWWLLARFEIVPGIDQCSRQLHFPLLLLSCIAALAVFWRWPNVKQR